MLASLVAVNTYNINNTTKSTFTFSTSPLAPILTVDNGRDVARAVKFSPPPPPQRTRTHARGGYETHPHSPARSRGKRQHKTRLKPTYPIIAQHMVRDMDRRCGKYAKSALYGQAMRHGTPRQLEGDCFPGLPSCFRVALCVQWNLSGGRRERIRRLSRLC